MAKIIETRQLCFVEVISIGIERLEDVVEVRRKGWDSRRGRGEESADLPK